MKTDTFHVKKMPSDRNPRPIPSHQVSALFLVISLIAGTAYADGLGNKPYPGGKNKVIAHFNSKSGFPGYHGHVAMVQGYLLIPRYKSGGFSLVDISDPSSPKKISDAVSSGISETHSIGISGDKICLLNGSGVEFWDLADTKKPAKLGSVRVDGAGTDRWMTWQPPYVYHGASDKGLNIIDAIDLRNPKFVKRLPTSKTGGFKVGPVDAIGNLLVLSWYRNDGSGISTLDISNPAEPVLLDALIDGSFTYSSATNGNRLYGFSNKGHIFVYDLSNPENLRNIKKIENVGGKGGYGMVSDGFVHAGFSEQIVKVEIDSWKIDNRVNGNTLAGHHGDWDFSTPLGNLVFQGDDDGNGSVLFPHSETPDRKGPTVNMVVPKSGAVNQALTTRVGLTLTDLVDGRTMKASSFIVREKGGAQVEGTYSQSHQAIVNFSPSKPLRPGTEYEVFLPKGGLRDYAGNPLETEFRSAFKTQGHSTGPTTLSTAPAEHRKTVTHGALRGWKAGNGSLLRIAPVDGFGPLLDHLGRAK